MTKKVVAHYTNIFVCLVMANELVQRAVHLVGSQAELGRRCGKKQGHVWSWLNSERVSAETAILIDAATGGAVSKCDLRPDIFRNRDERAA
ncbi:MAG: helix-turn-helix domain-containing protein [Alphaproteobacteria bacterium]|nr:helix-turn-helix domain-containing protein [Alphaproteobacteria bacterium]